MNEPADTSTRPRRQLSRKKKLLFASSLWFIFAILLYATSIGWRSHRLYGQMKQGRGWKVAIHEGDPDLGFRPIAGVESAELFRVGPPVPTYIDARGFRVPAKNVDEPTGPDSPLVMTFGCSFTFGAACPAEETFPQLVSQELGGTCINAGVCSYSLAQMLLRARQLVPEYRPDVVVVQYSPWLVDRSMSLYAPSYFGKLPTPFFSTASDGTLEIAPPAFQRSSIEPRAYRDSPKSFGEFTSFLFSVGTPLLLHDDSLVTWTWLQQQLGRTAVPTQQRQAIVDAVYGELDQLCQQVGAQLIIVLLDENYPAKKRERLTAATHATVVDAHGAMAARMPFKEATEFQKLYCHWRGDPPELVDHHPNARAHQIITREILKALE